MSWNDDEPRPETSGRFWRDVIVGIILVFFLHLVIGGLAIGGVTIGEATGFRDMQDVIGGAGMLWFMGIGCSQLVYVIPLWVLTFMLRPGMAAGVSIAAAVTFLLNGACYGVFCGALLGGSGF